MFSSIMFLYSSNHLQERAFLESHLRELAVFDLSIIEGFILLISSINSSFETSRDEISDNVNDASVSKVLKVLSSTWSV